MGQPAEISIREHRVVFERDLIRLYLNGIYTPDDFWAVIAAVDSTFKAYPQVYLMMDLSGLEAFPPATRSAWIKWVKELSVPQPKVCVVGANFTLRAVIMMMKAMRRLMAPATGSGPMLCDSEAQALAYLNQLRANQAARSL